MIEFIQNDTNLTKIQRESKLFNFVTRYKYRVYGLRQQDNPPVLIEYHYDKVDEHFDEKLDAIVEFCKSNGIQVDTYNEAETNRVDIGLRKDIRLIVNKNKKPLLAASLLSSIIYALEGRTDIEQLKKYKITSMPTLTSTPNNLEHLDGSTDNDSNGIETPLD